MDDERVVFDLSRSEALVLFEWLARSDETSSFAFEHEAEQRAVWLLEGKLEKALREVVDPNYKLMLQQAKEDLLGTDDVR